MMRIAVAALALAASCVVAEPGSFELSRSNREEVSVEIFRERMRPEGLLMVYYRVIALDRMAAPPQKHLTEFVVVCAPLDSPALKLVMVAESVQAFVSGKFVQRQREMFNPPKDIAIIAGNGYVEPANEVCRRADPPKK